MLICRLLESPNLSKPLHVHDEPSTYADIQRNVEMGWCQHLDVCFHAEIPVQSGDPGTSFKTIVDATRDGTARLPEPSR